MSFARKMGRAATRADLEALPASLKGEIIDGELYTQPRPRPRHSVASKRLSGALGRGAGGDELDPPGWIILDEPGIELPDAPEVAPDLAGWHRDRLAGLDLDQPIRVVPDWIAEVLSPSNRGYDRVVKFPFYARVGVKYLWVIDPPAKAIEVKRLSADGRWTDIAAFGDDDVMKAEPFEEIPIKLSQLWSL